MKPIKSEYYLLFIIYLSVVLLKLFLSPLIPTPTILGDEVIYLWIAQAPFENQIVVGNQYPPLYPFVLSLFPSDNIQGTYFIAKTFNIFISSLIVFPAYFLSKLFLSKQLSLITALFSLFIPINFTYSFLVMSENLFYPLFLTSVYLIFKSEKEDKKWLYTITGVVIALAVLTRIIGLVLIVTYILYLIYRFIRFKEYNTKTSLAFLSFSIVTIPYFIFYKSIQYGLSEKGIFGYSIIEPINRHFCIIQTSLRLAGLNITYLISGAGIILGLLSLVAIYKLIKDRKDQTIEFENFIIFSWICIIFTIIISSLFLVGCNNIEGRYIAFLIPLVFIMGFKGLNSIVKSRMKKILIVVIILGLLLLSTFSNFYSRSVSSQQTFSDETIGKYIQECNRNVVYDEDTYKDLRNYFWRLRFWSSKRVNIGNINTDEKLFVSSKQLSYPILDQQNVTSKEKSTILYLYKL